MNANLRRELERWDESPEMAVAILSRWKAQIKPKVKVKRAKPTREMPGGRLILSNYDWGKQRQKIYKRDGGICQICGVPVGNEPWEIDHVEPRKMGGGARDDRPENLRLSHQRCNRLRGSRRDV